MNIIESAAKIIEDNSTLQENIRETNKFKEEISVDFEKLKMSLITTEQSINGMNIEKSELVLEIQKWKEKNLDIEAQLKTVREEYDRVLWDILFSLETARKRYGDNEILKKGNFDKNWTLINKIKLELENPDNEKLLSRNDRKSGIIKYIGILDQMLTVFTTEIRTNQEICLKVPDLQKEILNLKEKLENNK